jgi:glucose-6-phosphate-specific signal transduction histidine kinase
VVQKILQSKLNTFILVVFAYFLIHFSNNVLNDFLVKLPEAGFVHIPSGFKLFFVLIAGWLGAVGIATATLFLVVMYEYPDDYFLGFQLAVMSGLAPYLAKKLAVQKFAMNDDLSHITTKQLVLVVLIFAFLNSSFNYAVLSWNEVNPSFIDETLTSFIADITGTFIVFLLLKLMSKKLLKVAKS